MEQLSVNQKLWNKYVGGDKRAFGQLYRSLHKELTMYCYGFMKDLPLAENAASDALTRLLQHKEPDRIKNIESWIFMVAKNICYSYKNKDSRRKTLWQSMVGLISGRMDTGNEPMLVEQDAQIICRNTLDPIEFEVWNLHLKGYNNSEIAEQVKIAAKTVANKKTSARHKLQKAYAKIDR